MKKNLIKKISMVVASLALIIPLASVNEASVSAHRVHHARVVRVMKRNNKRAHKHVAKGMRLGAAAAYNVRVNKALNQFPKNKVYNQGFNDALNAKVNHRLAHNANYEKGYLQIIALDNYTDPMGKQLPKHLSKSALKSAAVYYQGCIL
ncbi:hypothetical protein [Acetilactobacillus jinshanensis]|uniref:SCP domain-containing protein n=1 Tax=Acetilactobacillus jinshanensis TaxID=1720083 RepID=A0A4P6ZKZ4_9LACO|nr:hypothetical protein [Acetilactobacillus jinshanensis]QBP18491.1 hypothetical protein ELX58_04940 [Acetilactobacillus jinshanensis]URL61362.1 hypothetical protein HGK75_05055 [uncultured bacterium]